MNLHSDLEHMEANRRRLSKAIIRSHKNRMSSEDLGPSVHYFVPITQARCAVKRVSPKLDPMLCSYS